MIMKVYTPDSDWTVFLLPRRQSYVDKKHSLENRKAGYKCPGPI